MNNDNTTPNHYSEDELGLYDIAQCWAYETNNPTPNAKLRTLVEAVTYWLSLQKEIEEVFPTNVQLPFNNIDDKEKYLECKEQYRNKRHHFQLKLRKEYTENKMYVLMPSKEPLITDLDNKDNNYSGLYTFLTHLDVNNLTESQIKQLDQILIGRIIFLRWARIKTKTLPKFWRKPIPPKYLQTYVTNKRKLLLSQVIQAAAFALASYAWEQNPGILGEVMYEKSYFRKIYYFPETKIGPKKNLEKGVAEMEEDYEIRDKAYTKKVAAWLKDVLPKTNPRSSYSDTPTESKAEGADTEASRQWFSEIEDSTEYQEYFKKIMDSLTYYEKQTTENTKVNKFNGAERQKHSQTIKDYKNLIWETILKDDDKYVDLVSFYRKFPIKLK